MKKIAAAALVALSMTFGMQAQATSLTFSFSNTTGTTNGTVTGHINGLTDNATSAATSVYIDSFPMPLDDIGYESNVFDWANVTITENSFTLSDGALVSGSFVATVPNESAQLSLNSDCCGGAGTNFLNVDGDGTRNVSNDQGLEGLNATPVTSDVPEPASWAMMVGGFGLIGAAMRRKATRVQFA